MVVFFVLPFLFLIFLRGVGVLFFPGSRVSGLFVGGVLCFGVVLVSCFAVGGSLVSACFVCSDFFVVLVCSLFFWFLCVLFGVCLFWFFFFWVCLVDFACFRCFVAAAVLCCMLSWLFWVFLACVFVVGVVFVFLRFRVVVSSVFVIWCLFVFCLLWVLFFLFFWFFGLLRYFVLVLFLLCMALFFFFLLFACLGGGLGVRFSFVLGCGVAGFLFPVSARAVVLCASGLGLVVWGAFLGGVFCSFIFSFLVRCRAGSWAFGGV